MAITKILYHPLTILGLTILAVMFFFSLDKSGKKTQNSSENIKVLEHEITQISQEVLTLEEKIAQTDSPEFKEKVVRNELLLQKPGEYILQIAENNQENDAESCDNEDCEPELNQAQTAPIFAWRDLLF